MIAVKAIDQSGQQIYAHKKRDWRFICIVGKFAAHCKLEISIQFILQQPFHTILPNLELCLSNCIVCMPLMQTTNTNQNDTVEWLSIQCNANFCYSFLLSFNSLHFTMPASWMHEGYMYQLQSVSHAASVWRFTVKRKTVNLHSVQCKQTTFSKMLVRWLVCMCVFIFHIFSLAIHSPSVHISSASSLSTCTWKLNGYTQNSAANM